MATMANGRVSPTSFNIPFKDHNMKLQFNTQTFRWINLNKKNVCVPLWAYVNHITSQDGAIPELLFE